MTDQRVVAVLGRGVVQPDSLVLRADDLGVVRGDGIFETVHVRDGRPWLLDEHLARMVRSASRLDIALPPREALIDLAEQALAGWPADVEAALRLVCTRGPESGGTPTVFATVTPVAATTRRARRDGVRVITATLGVAATARPAAPWLLGGAKTLSYAVNMASQRWATSQGADDVLWLSADGYALEAPTSTLLWLVRDTLCTVPAEATGILAGTTARHLLDHADSVGLGTDERLVTVDDLVAADGVWLASSVRGLAEVRSLDGKALGPSPVTDRLADLVGHPR
ncbi:MAG TPA: aminotransferase class IV [Micromonosporaceae bacterium]